MREHSLNEGNFRITVLMGSTMDRGREVSVGTGVCVPSFTVR